MPQSRWLRLACKFWCATSVLTPLGLRQLPSVNRWRHVQIPVERIEALLLWRDPYASAKVFGGGLYILICLRHLVCGEGPSQLQIYVHLLHGCRFPSMPAKLRLCLAISRVLTEGSVQLSTPPGTKCDVGYCSDIGLLQGDQACVHKS